MKSPIKTALLSIILSFAMTLVTAADVATCTTESPLTVFADSGKYGYKNEAGEVVIEARYDEADPFEGGYAIVMSGGKYGVINTSGNCVVDCVYDGVTCLKTESVPRYQSANKQIVIDVVLYFKVVRNGGGDVVVLKSSLNHDVEPFVIGEYSVMLMDNICYVFDFMGMLTTKVWYDNVEVEYDGHLLVLSKGNKSFVISESSIMADNMAYYDAVEQMECGLYVTRNNNRYGIVSVDGRELAQPEMLHVDLKANGWCWLCNERGECFYLSIPEDVANAEVMTLAQYKEQNDNPWDNDYSYNNPKAVTGKSLTKCIGFKQFSDWDQKEYEVNIGEDTYPHRLLYDIAKWGDKRIVVVRHCLNGENYIYIERGGKVISELAYSQISAFAFEYIGRIGSLTLCSFQQLANGDLLIESKANVVDFYCDGASDISYCLDSGEWCDLSNIISETYYHGSRFDCRLCFVLDVETFELKDCTILDEDYRVLGVSAYDGWYASSGGGWQSYYNNNQAYEHLNISHGAVVRLSNEGGFQGVYTVGEGERFMNIFETWNAVFFGGVTKNRGYITKDNPCVWVHNRDTWVPIWVESYSCLSDEECFAADDCVDFRHWKLNGGVVKHLRFDKGKIVCYETKDSKTYQYTIDFADMEPDRLRIACAQHKGIWAYGLVNQFGNWVVPPVLPGDEPVSYGDWTICPAEVCLDHGCVQTTCSAIIKYQGMYGRYVNDCWLFDPVYNTPEGIANIDVVLFWYSIDSSSEPQRIFIKKVGLDDKTLYGWMGWRGYDDVFVYPKYEDFGSESEIGLRSVRLNGKWGWVDAYDNVVIPLIYDDIDAIYDDGDDSFYFYRDNCVCLVWKDGKCGGKNSKGEVVIPIIYDPEDVERTEDDGMILFNDPMYYYYSASGELLKTEERVAPIVNHKADVEVLEDVLTIVSNDTKIEVPQALYVEEVTFDTIVFDVKPEEVVESIDEEIFVTAEEMPTFQGGDLSKFRSWVQSNVLYPQIAQENGIQGNVVVKFIIEKDGTLSNILVLQSPDQSLSDAVIQVLRKSPKWKPGKQRNKPLRVTFTLPVAFKLLQ